MAVVIGVIASFIVVLANHHASKTDTGVGASVDEESDLEGSWGSNVMFLVAVFSIIAFLIIWLVNAVLGRGLL